MRKSNIDTSKIICGFHYGEHKMQPETMLEEILEMCKGYVNGFTIRPNTTYISDELFKKIALTAKENNLYFAVVYAYQFPPKGKISHFNAELIKSIKDIAGEYFLGELMGEAGSDKAAKCKGYYFKDTDVIALKMPPQNFKNMQEAKENYIKFVSEMTDYDKSIGLKETSLIEATAFSRYNLEGGIETPILEVMPGQVDILTAFTRGAARGYDKSNWGGFIANEWYGGYRHQDILKAKRLDLAYKYLYLSGATRIWLESGNNEIKSFGYEFDKNSEECVYYRNTAKSFYEFTQKDKRLPQGPITKIAFIHGNLDPYTNFMGSSAWTQFDKEEWGINSPEYSWKILDEVYSSSEWYDSANFGDGIYDMSASPAYGNYDVLPIESDISIMQNYDTLIFAGWNTMTESNYNKLKKYVENGGHLIISASHLNTSDTRDGKFDLLNGGKFADFLGCDIIGSFRSNDGVKFKEKSLVDNVLYPGTKSLLCDCNYTGQYALYAKTELKGGYISAFLEDKFFPAPDDWSKINPLLIENKYGAGNVSFLTNIDYPGHPGVYPKYKAIVKEILNSSHRNCDLKVISCDKIRYALYRNNDGKEKLYLLNTDYNCPQYIKVIYKDKENKITLQPSELSSIDY